MSLRLFPDESPTTLFAFKPPSSNKDEPEIRMIEYLNDNSARPIFSLKGIESLIDTSTVPSAVSANAALMDLHNLLDRSLHLSQKSPNPFPKDSNNEILKGIVKTGKSPDNRKDALYFEGLLKIVYSLDSNKPGKAGAKIRQFQRSLADELWSALSFKPLETPDHGNAEVNSGSKQENPLISRNTSNSIVTGAQPSKIASGSPMPSRKSVSISRNSKEEDERLLKGALNKMVLPPTLNNESSIPESRPQDSKENETNPQTASHLNSLIQNHLTKNSAPVSDTNEDLIDDVEKAQKQQLKQSLTEERDSEDEESKFDGNEIKDDDSTLDDTFNSSLNKERETQVDFSMPTSTASMDSSKSKTAKQTTRKLKSFFGEGTKFSGNAIPTSGRDTVSNSSKSNGVVTAVKIKNFFGDEGANAKAALEKWSTQGFPQQKVLKVTDKKKIKESKDLIQKKVAILKKINIPLQELAETMKRENSALSHLANSKNPDGKLDQTANQALLASINAHESLQMVHSNTRASIFDIMSEAEAPLEVTMKSDQESQTNTVNPAPSEPTTTDEKQTSTSLGDSLNMSFRPLTIEVFHTGAFQTLRRRKSGRQLFCQVNPINGKAKISLRRVVAPESLVVNDPLSSALPSISAKSKLFQPQSTEIASIYPEDMMELDLSGKQVSMKYRVGPRSTEAFQYKFGNQQDKLKFEQFVDRYFRGK